MPIVPGYPCSIPGYPCSIPGYPWYSLLSLGIIFSLSLTMVEEGAKLQLLGIKEVLVLINMAAMT